VIGLTPFEQAQRSWAKSISSYSDVPPDYAAFFEPWRARGAPFPLVVIAPSYEGFLHRQVERLVCATSDDITIVERRGHRLVPRRYPISQISCVEVSAALLDARLRIIGLEGDDRLPSSTLIRFNAVTDFLFTPVVARIRSAGQGPRPQPAEESGAFQAWGRRSFKFMNYAKRSLLGNEAVLQAILQPEIRMRVVSAFGRSLRRTLSATHATILTEHELISIRELASPGDQERYGGTWDYMPLRKIAGLSVSRNGHGLLRLEVELFGGFRFDLLYETSVGADLDAMVAKVTELGHGNAEARYPTPSGTGHEPRR
jgi:hypothetical protein